MKEIINSLSFGSAALLVAIVSAIISFGLSRVESKKIKWMSGLIIPFFIAYFLYWSPVFFFGADPSEYGAWSGIFIIPWYAAGTFASILVLFIIDRIKHQRKEQRNKQCNRGDRE